ncbi:hypothetical protein RvVAR0630_10530 [Agrobacterium vitis]|nr:hypothetical protein RvVAR0630_10530 [Agrobacterium vitis]
MAKATMRQPSEKLYFKTGIPLVGESMVLKEEHRSAGFNPIRDERPTKKPDHRTGLFWKDMQAVD